MNERINKLVKQCSDTDLIESDDGGMYVQVFDTQKLAELIVQEVCWDMINSHLDKTRVNRVAKSWGVDIGVEE